jgi:hypothetical protein
MKLNEISEYARRLVTENGGVMKTVDLHAKLVELARDKNAVDQAFHRMRSARMLIHEKGFDRLGR